MNMSPHSNRGTAQPTDKHISAPAEQLQQSQSHLEGTTNEANTQYCLSALSPPDSLPAVERVLDFVMSTNDEKVRTILQDCLKSVWQFDDLAGTIFGISEEQRHALVRDDDLASILLTPSMRDLRFRNMPPPSWVVNLAPLRWRAALIGQSDEHFDTALDILRHTATSAMALACYNPQEFVFQMEARLHHLKSHHLLVDRYLLAVRKFVTNPSVHPLVPCFMPPFGVRAHTVAFKLPVYNVCAVNSNNSIAAVVTQRRINLVEESPEGTVSHIIFTEVGKDVVFMTVSPDGKTLATALKGGLLLVWDIPRSCVLATPHIPCDIHGSEQVLDMMISQDGFRLIVAYARGVVRIWELPHGKLLHNSVLHTDRNSLLDIVALLDDGNYIATCDAMDVYAFADTKTGDYHPCLMPLGFTPSRASGSARARRVTWASCDGRVVVADMTHDGVPKSHVLHGRRGVVTTLEASDDGRLVVAGSSDGTVRVWTVMHPESPRRIYECGSAVHKVCIRNFGKGDILTMDSSGKFYKWVDRVEDIVNHGMRRRHEDSVTCVTASADGRRVISGGRDGSLFVWDVLGGGLIASVPRAHVEEVTHVEPWGFDMVTSFGRYCSVVWRISNSSLEKVKVDNFCEEELLSGEESSVSSTGEVGGAVEVVGNGTDTVTASNATSEEKDTSASPRSNNKKVSTAIRRTHCTRSTSTQSDAISNGKIVAKKASSHFGALISAPTKPMGLIDSKRNAYNPTSTFNSKEGRNREEGGSGGEIKTSKQSIIAPSSSAPINWGSNYVFNSTTPKKLNGTAAFTSNSKSQFKTSSSFTPVVWNCPQKEKMLTSPFHKPSTSSKLFSGKKICSAPTAALRAGPQTEETQKDQKTDMITANAVFGAQSSPLDTTKGIGSVPVAPAMTNFACEPLSEPDFKDTTGKPQLGELGAKTHLFKCSSQTLAPKQSMPCGTRQVFSQAPSKAAIPSTESISAMNQKTGSHSQFYSILQGSNTLLNPQKTKLLRQTGELESVPVKGRHSGNMEPRIHCDGRYVLESCTGKVLATLPYAVTSTEKACCVSLDGSLLVTGLVNGDVFWFSLKS